jgi:hypothetical protein
MGDLFEALYEYFFERFAEYVFRAVLVVSLLYGAITGSSEKAGQMYFRSVQFLAAPIVNSDARLAQELMRGIQNSANRSLEGKPTH